MPVGAALGAAAGGAALSASSTKKAANKAADTSLAVAEKNNALQREIYGQNQTALQPYMQRGNVAGDYLNAFLGLPSATQASATASTGSGGLTQPGGIVGAAAGSGMFGTIDPRMASMFPNAFAGKILNGTYPDGTVVGPNAAAAAKPTAPTANAGDAGVTQADARNAFASYLSNGDFAYQSALGGQEVAGNYSGLGAFQSGAAMKALQTRQNNINQGYQSQWTGLLGNQQGVGLSGASALAGVGQSYAASVGANNTAAGNASANAALIKGQNNPFANALSTLGGGLLGLGSGSGGGYAMGSSTTWPRGIY